MTPNLISPALLIQVIALSPLAAVAVFMGLILLGNRRLETLEAWITVFFSAISLLASVMLATSYRSATGESGGIAVQPILGVVGVYVDALGIFMLLLVNLVVFAASFYVRPYLVHQRILQNDNPEISTTPFHFAFNLFHLSMALLPMVENLYILWLMLAITTVASIYLVGYRRDKESMMATESYIFITICGMFIALLGTYFLKNALDEQSTPMNWPILITSSFENNPILVNLSFLFILFGYGLKAALFPGQSWLPDAHGESPFPISALLSGVLVKSSIYAIIRLSAITNHALNDQGAFCGTLLVIYGLISLGLSAPLILGSLRFKRVLAYHTLLHVSWSVCGLGVGLLGTGPGSEIALMGAILHLGTHAMTKTLMFLGYGSIQIGMRNLGQSRELEIHGISKTMPIHAVFLGLGGLALVGTPWFGIFISELMILAGIVTKIIGSQPELNPSQMLLVVLLCVFMGSTYLIYTGLVHHLKEIILGLPIVKESGGTLPERNWLVLAFLLLLMIGMGTGILQIGKLDLFGLLREGARWIL